MILENLDNTCLLAHETYVVYTISPYILHPFKHGIYIMLCSLYPFTYHASIGEEPNEEETLTDETPVTKVEPPQPKTQGRLLSISTIYKCIT